MTEYISGVKTEALSDIFIDTYHELRIQKHRKHRKHLISQAFPAVQQQGMRESNSHQRFWRPLSYHLTNPLYNLFLNTEYFYIIPVTVFFVKRRWRDLNPRAGCPAYRISSADPSTAWVHLQIYVISLVPTRRPIQPVEIGKNNRIEQATLFNLNSAGTRMVPRVSAVWHSA